MGGNGVLRHLRRVGCGTWPGVREQAAEEVERRAHSAEAAPVIVDAAGGRRRAWPAWPAWPACSLRAGGLLFSGGAQSGARRVDLGIEQMVSRPQHRPELAAEAQADVRQE